MRRSLAAALSLSLASVILGGGSATAAPPDRDVFPIDIGPALDDFWTDACGEEITTSVSGTALFRHRADARGQLIRSVGTTHARIVAEGPGGTVAWSVGFSQRVVYAESGEDLLYLSGRLGPGDVSGHMVIDRNDPDDPQDDVVLQVVGNVFDLNTVCAALV